MTFDEWYATIFHDPASTPESRESLRKLARMAWDDGRLDGRRTLAGKLLGLIEAGTVAVGPDLVGLLRELAD